MNSKAKKSEQKRFHEISRLSLELKSLPNNRHGRRAEQAITQRLNKFAEK